MKTDLFFLLFLCSCAVSSCSSHVYTEDELSGIYKCYRSAVPHDYNVYSQMMDYEAELKLLGDYWHYSDKNNFSPTYLILNNDGTFKYTRSLYIEGWGGKWIIEGNNKNSIKLTLDSIPPMGRMESNYTASGIRVLTVINKNKLRYECKRFNAPEQYKYVSIFKRIK